MRESCENCKYFLRAFGEKGAGKCVRFPPISVDARLPIVQPGHWCGEWKSVFSGALR